MAANIFQKAITLTADWQKLAGTALVLNATLQAAADNYGPVSVRINDDNAGVAEWFAGATVGLQGVDLSMIEVKGNPGDRFLVVGNTR